MKPENIKRYITEKTNLLVKKKIQSWFGLTAIVIVLNSIFVYSTGQFQVSFWLWVVGLFVFLCWTIAVVTKTHKRYIDDLLYEGVTLILWSFAVISIGIKAILGGWGYVSPAIILSLMSVIVVLNVFATIKATRKRLSKETYVSYQNNAKEPDAIFVFVGGTILSGIVFAYFTRDTRDTLFLASLVLITSVLLHLGCRYCYKAYLIKKYSAEILIENQPEEAKLADRLDDKEK